MEGLLRKYKISKISDNVKLSDQELKLCLLLDKTLIGLTKFKNCYYMNNEGCCVLEFTNLNDLYISSKNCWNFLDDYGLQYADIQIVVRCWVEDLYKLKVNTTTRFNIICGTAVEDLYKLKVNTTININ